MRVVTKYSLSWKEVLLMIVVVVTMGRVSRMVKVVQTVKVEKEVVMLAKQKLKLVDKVLSSLKTE